MLVDEVRWQFYPRAAAHAEGRRFIESLVKRGKSPKTIDAYARCIDDLIGTLGAGRVIDADADDFDTYLAHLRAREPARGRKVLHLNGTGLSDNTIHQRVVVARLFFDFCIHRRLRQDPFNPVPLGRWATSFAAVRGPVPKRLRLPWIPDDPTWRALIADLFAHDTLRDQTLVVLGYDAALRRAELVGLRLDDVDWSIGTVRVRVEHAKGGRERVVPISSPTLQLLGHYVHTIRARLLEGFGGEVAGPIFLSESQRNPGAALAPGALNDIIGRLRTRLGLSLLHPHTLRHLRCTVLRRGGMALDDIALFAGHAKLESTRIYVHLAPLDIARQVRDATAVLDRHVVRLIEGSTHGA